jgi:hypothetical protein
MHVASAIVELIECVVDGIGRKPAQGEGCSGSWLPGGEVAQDANSGLTNEGHKKNKLPKAESLYST